MSNLSSNIDNLIVDFDDFICNGNFPACDHLFLCLGTTIKKAGNKNNFKKIDHDYTIALAEKAKKAGALKVSLISSVGADVSSKNFYLSTKGKIEKKIEALDFLDVTMVLATKSALTHLYLLNAPIRRKFIRMKHF